MVKHVTAIIMMSCVTCLLTYNTSWCYFKSCDFQDSFSIRYYGSSILPSPYYELLMKKGVSNLN